MSEQNRATVEKILEMLRASMAAHDQAQVASNSAAAIAGGTRAKIGGLSAEVTWEPWETTTDVRRNPPIVRLTKHKTGEPVPVESSVHLTLDEAQGLAGWLLTHVGSRGAKQEAGGS